MGEQNFPCCVNVSCMPYKQEHPMYTYVYSLDIFIVCHLFLHSKRYEVIDVFAKERRTNMIIALKYSFYLPLCLSSKRASSKGREIHFVGHLPTTHGDYQGVGEVCCNLTLHNISFLLISTLLNYLRN